MRLDGEIPFYSEGQGWQRQHHIYSSPFYYIDYCLAQTVSLQFWALHPEKIPRMPGHTIWRTPVRAVPPSLPNC